MKSSVFVIFAFVLVAAGCDGHRKSRQFRPRDRCPGSKAGERGFDLQCEEINKNGTCFTSEGEAR